MNSVILVGRLTRDAEVKTPNEDGKSVISFILAVNRSYPNSNNEYEADFIPISIWREKSQAENLSSYLLKGKRIGIEGRINVRSYVNEEGKKRYITQVIADKVNFLDSMKKEEII